MTDFGGLGISRQDSKAALTENESGYSRETASEDKDPYFRYKMTKQLCLVGVWICMASIRFCIFWPITCVQY